MATNPFVFDVADVLNGGGMPVSMTQEGPSPSRIGPEMIAVPKGSTVTVEAVVTPLGSGIMVDATATGTLEGQCVRCLSTLTPEFSATVNQVFSSGDDFIHGDPESDDDAGSGDEIPEIEGTTVNLEQAFVDELGMNLPFNPVCEPECVDASDVPEPDGVSGEAGDSVDPRWAALEKFL
ncbi:MULTISPECIES: YceD family protein [unclassified Corynebacterium]|uniref:YceD family protein n=1 Tax=unclassified Corynebacterium TaxID=2624378 RepID=UPI002A913014|nr:YceD family protein [Corynebacterium sp.]MDY5784561.1 YceD family protein [Corynebacterium sp.]